jgi:hypothetical protein
MAVSKILMLDPKVMAIVSKILMIDPNVMAMVSKILMLDPKVMSVSFRTQRRGDVEPPSGAECATGSPSSWTKARQRPSNIEPPASSR